MSDIVQTFFACLIGARQKVAVMRSEAYEREGSQFQVCGQSGKVSKAANSFGVSPRMRGRTTLEWRESIRFGLTVLGMLQQVASHKVIGTSLAQRRLMAPSVGVAMSAIADPERSLALRLGG